MKYVAVAEAKAKLSHYIEEAQREPVVILSYGKPAAMVVGLSGMSLDEVAGDDRVLLELLKKRASSKTVPWKTAKKAITGDARRTPRATRGGTRK